LLEPIGDVPPVEFEQMYHQRQEAFDIMAAVN